MFCDNLAAHQREEFKVDGANHSGLVWYGLPNGTDAGFAKVLKQLIGIEQREWLDCDDNAD